MSNDRYVFSSLYYLNTMNFDMFPYQVICGHVPFSIHSTLGASNPSRMRVGLVDTLSASVRGAPSCERAARNHASLARTRYLSCCEHQPCREE